VGVARASDKPLISTAIPKATRKGFRCVIPLLRTS
jgi:hypothetical protein